VVEAGRARDAWGAVVALVVFAAYLASTAPTPYLLDSAELAAAAFGLGVAHPPGEALALLWGKLFTLLPLGSVAFRVGVSQAVAGAAAAWLVFHLTQTLIDRVDPGGVVMSPLRSLLAGAAALAFALAPGTVLNSNRPEVYALATALALAALAATTSVAADPAAGVPPAPSAAAQAGSGALDARSAVLGALLVGLGVANHPLVAGLAGVGAVAAALPLLGPRAPAARGRLVLLVLAAFAVGLAALAYLPARAAALYAAGAPADTIVWGDARSTAGWWWIVSGRTFLNKSEIVHTGSAPELLPFAIGEEVGLPLLLLALAGLYHVVRSPRARRPGLPLAIALAGSALAAVGAGFDPHNPDIRGYLGVALAGTAILGVAGLTAVVAPIGRRWVATVAAAALTAAATWHALPIPTRVDLHAAAAADTIAAEMLAEVPPRAAVLTSHFETGFLVGYQRLVEARRPDVAWIHLGFVRGPGYADRLSAAHPDLAATMAAHRRADLTAGQLRALPRPVRLEPDQHLRPDLQAHLTPAGHLWQLPPPRPARTAPTARTDPSSAPPPLSPAQRAEAQRDRQVRGFLGWRAYVDSTLACHLRLSATAARRLADLTSLLPHDTRAATLLTHCPALHLQSQRP
jgi:hypothetical protein